MKRNSLRRNALSYAMLAPALGLFALFLLLPMALALVIAFKRIDLNAGLLESPWVGWQNFRDLFGNVILAGRVRTAFANTLLFTVCFVPLNIAASLAIATLVHGAGSRSQGFYRSAFYLPTVTSAIVFAMIWKWLYDPNFGLLNALLARFGVAPIAWTGHPDWAMWSVIIAALGAGPGANILIYLAALGSVPQDVMEAARVDGANPLARWWYVTLPALKPVTLYLIVLNTIGSFQVFELVFVLTGGGPAGSSTVIVFEIYNLAFGQGRYGIAGALSLLLLIIVATFAALQFFVFGRDNTRDGGDGMLSRAWSPLNHTIGMSLMALGQAIERWRRRAGAAMRRAVPAAASLRARRLPSPSHLLLLPLALLFLAPMCWMFLSALTPRVYLQTTPPQISVGHLSFENYRKLFETTPQLLRWFWNSLYLSLVIMAGQVLLSCFTGYVFARKRFVGRGVLFSLFVASIMLPGQALVIPLFLVISSGIRGVTGIDLLDTHWALILPALCSPVGIFLMRQYIDGLPIELEEAARIDGCGEVTTWWHVILPLCKPIMGAWAILSFTGVWRSFFWPFVVLGSEQLFTLEVGLQSLQQQNTTDFGLVMAGATMSAIPMILLFFVFQKQIVQGLTFGAVKG